jgi:Intracellular proteinase inhibitor
MFSDGRARSPKCGHQTFCPLVLAPAQPAVRSRRAASHLARQLAGLGAVVTLAAACGSQEHPFSLATAAAATNSRMISRAIAASGTSHARPLATTLATTLESSMDVSVNGEDVHFVMHVMNHTARKLEVTFPSGQTHDIAVMDAAGSEVWRWSSGQMFTQALRNQPLDPQASLSYSMHWRRPRAHGALTAIATLTSTNYPLESRAVFALP